MTSSHSNLNTANAEQRGLKQKRSVMLFTLFERCSTKVGIARHFGEPRKLVCCIHSTALPRNKGKILVTIRNPIRDRAFGEIHYLYFFLDSKGP